MWVLLLLTGPLLQESQGCWQTQRPIPSSAGITFLLGETCEAEGWVLEESKPAGGGQGGGPCAPGHPPVLTVQMRLSQYSPHMLAQAVRSMLSFWWAPSTPWETWGKKAAPFPWDSMLSINSVMRPRNGDAARKPWAGRRSQSSSVSKALNQTSLPAVFPGPSKEILLPQAWGPGSGLSHLP